MILCTAIKFIFKDFNNEKRETVICGYRHHNCYHIWHNYIKPKNCKELISEEQGFMDDTGSFVNREIARQIYIRDKQGIPKWSKLYSEDLY